MSRPHPAGPRHGDIIVDHPPLAPVEDATELDPLIWPAGVRREPDGELSVHGRGVEALAQEFDTPLHVLDSDDLRQRARNYVAAFTGEADVTVYYAAKAFLASRVARWMAREGLGIDVCSGGELALTLRAGIPAERVLFHGNNKSEAELHAALSAGVGRIVVDSFDELERISRIAGELGVVAPILIRVTLGVEAHTHEFIATAHEDQKFGFSLASGKALQAIGQALEDPSLQLLGIHSHIGSQIFVSAGFEVAAHRAVGLLAQVRDTWDVELPELNLGGGIGIKYVAGENPLDITVLAPEVLDVVRRECAIANLAVPRLAFEPGRAIVGPAAITVYRVGTVKRRTLEGDATRMYVSVDGGMSDNIRTALYDAQYTVTMANRVSSAPTTLARVVGKHCESGDIVVRDTWLPEDISAGDLLAVAATGAYNRSMASNYNLVPRPAVVACDARGVEVVLRRESLDDLFATDAGLA